MEEVNYANMIPATPPKGLVPWLLKKGMLKKELLVYKMDTVTEPLSGIKERMVKITCTACHESGYEPKVENGCSHGGPAFGFIHPETGETIGSGKRCLCPFCGCEVEAKHITSMSQMECIEAYPLTISRVEQRLVLQGWCVRKWFERDASSGITTWPYEAYVFEEKKTIRLTGYLKCMSTIRLFGHWEQRKEFYDNWGKADLIYPWDKRLLNDSTVENSKLSQFLGATKGTSFARPVTYLRFFQRHPAVENLVMQGAGHLLGELFTEEQNESGYYNYYGYSTRKAPQLKELHWKEARPTKILGLTKDELRRCVTNAWDASTYRFYVERKEEGRIYTDDELKLLVAIGLNNYEKLIREDGLDPLKVARYLQKQHAKDNTSDLNLLRDCWKMGKALGYNMKNPDFQFPPHLLRLHDRFAEEQRKIEKNKKIAQHRKQSKQIKERWKSLNVYAWEKDGLLIRPVKDYADLLREGDMQHHCVATYAESIASSKSAIFLIRHTAAPDHPYFTLELDEKTFTVRQNRGLRNCARTPEVEAFEAAWLAHIREVAAKAKKAKSKEKRSNAA